MEKKQVFSLWYFIAAVLAILLLQELFTRGHVETLAYNEFKTLLRAGKLNDVAVTDQMISGTVNTEGLEGVLPQPRVDAIRKGAAPHRFVTVKVDDPQLVADLETARINYAGQIESRWLSTLLSWVVPALVFFAIWSFLIRRMGMGMGGQGGLLEIGKSKAKVYMEKQTGVTFADVAGIDEAKQELMEVVEFLRSPDRYRRLGGKIPKGVLIVGAPGTGKTLLAKAVAGEAGVPFLTISGSDFVEMFVGVGAARVRDLFKQAEQKAPCIIFIDELDALGKARGVGVWGGHDEREQTLNQLLVEMDGFESNRGVIIMAATNRPEILDPALLRPGRFDRHVAIDKPDLKGRRAILDVHTRNVKLAPDLDLEKVAALTPGFAGADLANLVNEAALHAARDNKNAVEMKDFDAALDRIVAGLEKKNRVMNPKEKETVAYHEAGHAIVAESRPYADRVSKVSIIPRGIAALGYTQQQPTEDRYLLKKSELLDRIDVLLAGRVAEEIVYGDVSTGAQNDLQRATDIARSMVTHYGMSAELGLASFEEPRTTPFLPTPLPESVRNYSERTAQAIDGEVRKIMAEAQERVRQTLTAKRAALDALAKKLLEKEVVERSVLLELLGTQEQAPLPRAAFSRADATD
jgi:cell division protease FtsH